MSIPLFDLSGIFSINSKSFMHFFVDCDELSIFVLIMEGVEMTEEMINPLDYKSHTTQCSNGPVKIF